MSHILRVAILGAGLLVAGAINPATAERGAKPNPKQVETPAATAAAAVKLSIPGPRRISLLISTTVIALNQANVTGNYTVLRDLSAPGFQANNTAAQLAEQFARLRKSNRDLSPILLFEPQLVREARLEPNGLLRLSGFFATAPEQVNFDMAFQMVGGQWRLYGLALETRLAGDQAGPVAAAPAEPAAGSAPIGTEAVAGAKPGAEPLKAAQPASKQPESAPDVAAASKAAAAPDGKNQSATSTSTRTPAATAPADRGAEAAKSQVPKSAATTATPPPLPLPKGSARGGSTPGEVPVAGSVAPPAGGAEKSPSETPDAGPFAP